MFDPGPQGAEVVDGGAAAVVEAALRRARGEEEAVEVVGLLGAAHRPLDLLAVVHGALSGDVLVVLAVPGQELAARVTEGGQVGSSVPMMRSYSASACWNSCVNRLQVMVETSKDGCL